MPDAAFPNIAICNREDWHGAFISLDGAPTDDFTEEGIAAIIVQGDSGDVWDGEVAGIARLNDGRYVTWETFYGPTGNGFSEDAYGGDADLSFSYTYEAAVQFGLTDDGRALCGIEGDSCSDG